MIHTLLIVLIVLAILGSLPVYPYSRAWGYYPGGGLVVLLVVLLLLRIL